MWYIKSENFKFAGGNIFLELINVHSLMVTYIKSPWWKMICYLCLYNRKNRKLHYVIVYVLWINKIIRYHLPIDRSTVMGKWSHKVSFSPSRHEWCNLTNFYHPFFFINVTIRECNFTMGTISGIGFAQALVHTSQHLCCDLYALVLVQNPFPRLSPWWN